MEGTTMPILVDGELVLYGLVGEDFWDEGFTASQVVDALAVLGRDADVTVRINSAGGRTDDGIATYNALRAHRGTVEVVVDAIAASSASVIAMAGDTITMRSGALMMIHDPAVLTWGNAGDHEKSTERLNKLADLMADIYAERSGGAAAAIRSDMRAELWLTGDEAVARGFATDVEETRAVAACAFDYRMFAKAPRPLVAKSKAENWSFAVARDGAPRVRHPNREQETTMSDTQKAKDVQSPAESLAAAAPGAAVPETAAAAKARIKAIMTSAEAKRFPTLAEALAYDGDEPAEDALAKLRAVAADVPEARTDDAPDADAYRASRSIAAELAQPGAPAPSRARTIDTRAIYAARSTRKEA
jgi:ATP-dependent protease ClpP protease subunit